MHRKKKLVLWISIQVTALALTTLIIFLLIDAMLFFDPLYKKVLYAALAATIFLIISSFFGTLSSSIDYDNILQNFNRAQIYALIKNKPGVHFSEIIKNLSLSKGQASWHLSYLVRFDLVRKVKSSQYLLFFPNDGSYDQLRDSIAHIIVFKSESREKIFKEIIDEPGITQAKLNKKIKMSQSTIAYHLIILLQEELIIAEKKGRIRHYFRK
ncbi:MAG: winged helix-turn-helix transcriptional regulator [Candidatus Heimdallarchaeota archaeon]